MMAGAAVQHWSQTERSSLAAKKGIEGSAKQDAEIAWMRAKLKYPHHLFRGRPNRKWPTHARWSLRRSWRHVDAGSVPRVGQAFSFGAGGRGLAGLQAVKRAAAPTGIVHALDAERILRYAGLGRSRNVIDRPESCCSEQRGEGYTDHFRTFMGCRD